MPEVREYVEADGTCPFRDRFAGLADARAKARIDTTVRKLERGVTPDLKSVGEGVHEARIDMVQVTGCISAMTEQIW